MAMNNMDLFNYLFKLNNSNQHFVQNNNNFYSQKRFSNVVRMPSVKKVIFNNDVTLVYFDDGTRSIVKRNYSDKYNREYAIVYAIVKRAYGTVDPYTGIVNNDIQLSTLLSNLIKNGIDQEKIIAEKKLRKENAIARNNLTENVQTNNSVENNKNIKNQVLDLTRDCYYLLSLLNKTDEIDWDNWEEGRKIKSHLKNSDNFFQK